MLYYMVNFRNEVMVYILINLFFITIIIHTFIILYSIYTFFEIVFSHNLQGLKLNIKKNKFT